jgi:DNA-binding XRE family transcriptional regulator
MNPKEINPKHQEMLNKLGEKLKELRIMKNISSTGLAKEIGVSRNGYHQIEFGMVYFNISTLLKVLDYHKLSVSDFFNEL